MSPGEKQHSWLWLLQATETGISVDCEKAPGEDGEQSKQTSSKLKNSESEVIRVGPCSQT